MNRATSPLTGRIFVPALAALVLGWTGLTAHADLATARTALQAELNDFAADETLPGRTPVAVSTLTATADDLTYAVFQVSQHLNGFTAAELVQAALDGTPAVNAPATPRVRADLATVAARVVGATIGGADLETDGVGTLAVLKAAVDVNSTTGNARLQLTLAGKEVAVARALKGTVGLGTTIGTEAVTLAPAAPGVGDAKVISFASTVLKVLAASTGDVQDFTKQVLDTGVSTGDTAKKTAGEAIAAAIAAYPANAGAVIAGLATELKATAANTAAADTAINTLLVGTPASTGVRATAGLLTDARFARIQSVVIGSAVASYSGDKVQLAKNLVDVYGVRVNSTIEGNIASGIVQGLGSSASSSDVVGVLNAVYAKNRVGAYSRGVNSAADLIAFATAASTYNGSKAVYVNDAIAGKLSIQPTNLATSANITTLGASIIRAVAVTAPDEVQNIAEHVASTQVNGSFVFSDSPTATNSRLTLAATLVRYVPANVVAAAGAVAGVAASFNNGAPTLDQLVALAKGTLIYSPASASNITLLLSKQLPTTTTTTLFATTLATATGFNAAYAPATTAGIAAADPANAGDISAAVANKNSILQSKAFVIANTVAAKLDVERVNDVGQKIAALLRPAYLTQAGAVDRANLLPKLATIGTLGAGLAHVIQTTPLVPTANRADEIGELAAVLTNSVLDHLPAPTVGSTPSATDIATVNRTYVATLNSVAASIIAQLSARQLSNGGALAADKKDELEDIIGSIAQTISVSSSISTAIKGILLDNSTVLVRGVATPSVRGSLYATLYATATVYYNTYVNTAFANVKGAGIGTIYVDPTAGKNEVLTNGSTGKYEIGNVYEGSETTVKNVL